MYKRQPLFRSRLTATLRQFTSGRKEKTARNYLEKLSESDYTGKRIMLVEDNELNREIAGEILQMTGAVSYTHLDVYKRQEHYYNVKESSASTHICKFPSRYSLAYSSGSSMASVFNAQSDPGVVLKFFSASQQSMRSI